MQICIACTIGVDFTCTAYSIVRHTNLHRCYACLIAPNKQQVQTTTVRTLLASLLCILLLGRQRQKLFRSVLQVVHHTSRTEGLLTNDGVAVVKEASTITASAFLFKLVAYMLLHIAAGLPPALSVTAGTATQLIAGSFCAFSWSTGQFTVHQTCPSPPHIGSCLHFVFTQCDANASPL